jgi:hypothetical protein
MKIIIGCVEVYLKKLSFAGRVYFYLPQNKMFGFVRGILILKNLSTSVKKHESSKEHLTNILSLKRLENNTKTMKDALTEHSALSIKLPPAVSGSPF